MGRWSDNCQEMYIPISIKASGSIWLRGLSLDGAGPISPDEGDV